MSIDKEFAFQEAMVGSAIGSIAQLNERNLRLVKGFLDNQLKIREEEKAESQDSPFFIMDKQFKKLRSDALEIVIENKQSDNPSDKISEMYEFYQNVSHEFLSASEKLDESRFKIERLILENIIKLGK